MRHTNDWNNCFRSRQLPLVHYSYPHITTAMVHGRSNAPNANERAYARCRRQHVIVTVYVLIFEYFWHLDESLSLTHFTIYMLSHKMICNHFHVLCFHSFALHAHKNRNTQNPNHLNPIWLDVKLSIVEQTWTFATAAEYTLHTHTNEMRFTGRRRLHSVIVGNSATDPFYIRALQKAKKNRKKEKTFHFHLACCSWFYYYFPFSELGRKWNSLFGFGMFTSTISLRAEILLQQAKKI